MCRSCWADWGSPTELPPNADEIVTAFTEVYEHEDGGTGGPLHVQLDDFNVEGDWKPWDIDDEDRYYPDDLYEICSRVQALVAPLPDEQRAALIAYWNGWF